jgi:hypothetical protein
MISNGSFGGHFCLLLWERFFWQINIPDLVLRHFLS